MGRPPGSWPPPSTTRPSRSLWPVVLDALAGLRSRYDVVLCEGRQPRRDQPAGRRPGQPAAGPAAGLPAIVVGDIDRGGVFAAAVRDGGAAARRPAGHRPGSWSTGCGAIPPCWATLCADLERRCGVPTWACCRTWAWWTSTTRTRWPSIARPTHPRRRGRRVDVAAVRWPRVANAGDLDPLRLEPGVQVRWVRSAAELGRPDLVVLPGSKNTRDLAWFRGTGFGRRSSGRTPRWWRSAPGCKWRAGPSRTLTGSRAGRERARVGVAAGRDLVPGRQGARPSGGERHRGPGPGAGCGRLPHPPRAGPAGRAGAVAGGCGRRDPRPARRPVGGDDAARAVRVRRFRAGMVAWAAERSGKRWSPTGGTSLRPGWTG